MDLAYFDCHSHVTFKDYDADLDAVLGRMEENGVGTITVGVDKATSEEAVAFADGRDNFYATVGLHPTDTATETFTEADYAELVQHPKVVGIGECGLDYYRPVSEMVAEKKRQRDEFEKQITFAAKYLKPLMLHCRPTKGTLDAYEDALAILKPYANLVMGNVHFFVGDTAIARRFYELNFTTSFTGVVTFARDYDEVIKYAPVDMILTETDSPFATPEPHRGTRNEPTHVKYVVAAIARITDLPLERVGEQILENAKRVFAIS